MHRRRQYRHPKVPVQRALYLIHSPNLVLQLHHQNFLPQRLLEERDSLRQLVMCEVELVQEMRYQSDNNRALRQ